MSMASSIGIANKSNTVVSKRYETLDTLRGFALVNMLAFHTSYDLVEIFGVNWPFFHTQGAFYWQQMICILFIFISGCVASFSKSGLKNGIIVSAAGGVMTLGTYLFMPSQMIWCGVLSLLGVCILIVHFLKPILNKVPKLLGGLVAFILFIFTRFVPSGRLSFFKLWEYELPTALYESRWGFFLGFPRSDFFSSDYFPLIPWLLLFLFGFYIFGAVRNVQDEKKPTRALHIKIPLLSFVGKHTFIIYLIHQPIIYGVLFLLFEIF